MKLLLSSIIVGLAALLSIGTYLAIATDEITSQNILETDTTVIGQDIKYPSGPALIISKIVEIPIGAETGEHVHEYPMFAYMMEGEITVDYGENRTKTYLKGDSFMEAIDHVHDGKNTGSIPAEILIVLMEEK